ncbi:hypothetical protein SAMN05518672_11160 [Chitinophaga sp. CF118]|nr:hypothetical protein SAMN05518672_11160 [Chitinophaga sp. CF118]
MILRLIRNEQATKMNKERISWFTTSEQTDNYSNGSGANNNKQASL